MPPLVLLWFLAFVVPSAASSSSTTTTADPNEEDYYWDIQPYTDLYNHITAHKWSRALQALREDPDEASVLIVKRGAGSRGSSRGGGGISEQVLPIHKLFAVDIADDARRYDLPPSSTETNTSNTTMSAEQIDLAQELLRIHPLGARMVDHEGRLPLHLASYSVVSPPDDVSRRLMEAYNNGDGGVNGGSGSSDGKGRSNGIDQYANGGTHKYDAAGLTPLHAACSAPISSFEAISALLQANPVMISKRSDNKDEALPIHYAAWGGARHGSVEMVEIFQLLVQGYEEGLLVKDGDGDTPLDIMVKYGRTDLQAFEYVLGVVKDRLGGLTMPTSSSGDDAKSEEGDVGNTHSHSDGSTLLHNAVAMAPHHLTADMVRSILKIAPSLASQLNIQKQLPLHSALEHSGTTADIVAALLEAHVDGVRVEDGRTERLPLHMACLQGVGDVRAVELLVQAYPAAVLILDGHDGEDGRLPLHLALVAPQRGGSGGNDAVVQFLLEAGPSASATVDAKTDTYPLHQAIQRHRSPKLVKAILAAYPDAAVEVVGGTEQTSTSALHMLASSQNHYTPGEVVDIATAILEARPESAGILDGRGRLPLHLACDSSDDGARSKKPQRKTTEKTKPKAKAKGGGSEKKTLVGVLLDAYKDDARVKDSEGNLPLHFAVDAFDANITMQLLEAYQDGAADNVRPLLPIACGSLRSAYEPYSGEKDAVDRILKRLLSLSPDSAFIPDDGGMLPLSILLDRPNILEHVEAATFQMLLDANPRAAKHRVDDAGDYPLQKAISNMRNSKNAVRSLAFVELLLDAYPDVVRLKNDRDITALQQVLTQAQGTSRQGDANRALGQLAQRLYDLYPEAALVVDRSGHHPLHSLARIMGQTAGSSSRVSTWAQLFRDVLGAEPSVAAKTDSKGRSPLHILCFHLGDAAYDNEDGSQYERSAEFDAAVQALIEKSLNVLRLEDNDGQTSLDLLSRELKGRSSSKLSETLKFVKEEIKQARKKVPRSTRADVSKGGLETAKDEL